MSSDLGARGFVGLTRDAFAALHAALFRDAGAQAPGILQEAGYAGGGMLHQAFTQWCAEQGLAAPETLAAPDFGQRASDFFAALGWGPIAVATLHDSAMTVDASDWAEANPAAGMAFPGCYLSAGLLADFFTRLGGEPLVAMEVECRSVGHERCRFLLGSGETIQHVYDGLVNGVDYDTSLAQMA